MKLKTIVSNLAVAYQARTETLDGAEHVVVPCVMIVDGVLNGALVTHEEYGRYVEAWNGVPVPVLHPEVEGEPVSANSPHIHEAQNIGHVYNARVDDNKLVGELWINVQKATRLGFEGIVNALREGKVIEVSTSYFCDAEVAPGDFNGLKYNEIHRNLRPDHLALLPGQEGACSVKDGCGVRANGLKLKLNRAIDVLASALGLRVNKCKCQHEEPSMDLMKKLQGLKANGKLTQEHLDLIQSLDPEQVKMIQAILGALATEPAPKNEPEAAAAEAAPGVKPEDVEQMVANAVAKMKRDPIVARIKANNANALPDSALAKMDVAELEAYETSLRPVDYSGQGGFATHSATVDADASPLVAPRGIAGKKKEA